MNVRIIAVMSGGILFGPRVGAIVGAIAGVHRYLIDIDGVTAVPCFITSIVAGLLSGLINRKVAREQRWKIGILAGMMCETLTMITVVVWAPSLSLGVDIVSKIGIPMILGSVCIGFIVLLVQSVEGEKGGQRRGRRNWRSISPTKPCRCFDTLTAILCAGFARLSAATLPPTRWRSPIPSTCWPTWASVKPTINATTI